MNDYKHANDLIVEVFALSAVACGRGRGIILFASGHSPERFIAAIGSAGDHEHETDAETTPLGALIALRMNLRLDLHDELKEATATRDRLLAALGDMGPCYACDAPATGTRDLSHEDRGNVPACDRHRDGGAR